MVNRIEEILQETEPENSSAASKELSIESSSNIVRVFTYRSVRYLTYAWPFLLRCGATMNDETANSTIGLGENTLEAVPVRRSSKREHHQSRRRQSLPAVEAQPRDQCGRPLVFR